MTVWSILRPLEIFYGHLEYFVAIWYNFPHFGILDQEKSGNPGQPAHHKNRGHRRLMVARLPVLKRQKKSV
jgi:hypothetical protein